MSPRFLGFAYAAFVCPALLSASGLIITPVFIEGLCTPNGSTCVYPNGSTYAAPVSDAAAIESTINNAIAFYESTFSNQIDVTIDFDISTAISLGESSWNANDLSYSSYYTALKNSATSANDATALAILPSGSNDPAMNGSTKVVVKSALQAALGLNGQGASVNGGTITLNAAATTTGAGSSTGAYNLMAATEHEIDEVLGLGSSLGEGFPDPSAEDLFRYTSNGVRTYSTSAASAYFSINGGVTDLANFNQNSTGDYGDWTGSPSPNVQDAFASTSGPVLTASSVEVEALDVLGYTLSSTSGQNPTPEPGTGLLLVGTIAVCAVARRRAMSAERA